VHRAAPRAPRCAGIMRAPWVTANQTHGTDTETGPAHA
jgi:hypothetical protein